MKPGHGSPGRAASDPIFLPWHLGDGYRRLVDEWDEYDERKLKAIINRLQRRARAGGRIAMLEDPIFLADRTSMPPHLRKLLSGIEESSRA
jgi:hypothetical protein